MKRAFFGKKIIRTFVHEMSVIFRKTNGGSTFRSIAEKNRVFYRNPPAIFFILGLNNSEFIAVTTSERICFWVKLHLSSPWLPLGLFIFCGITKYEDNSCTNFIFVIFIENRKLKARNSIRYLYAFSFIFYVYARKKTSYKLRYI